eukprot:4735382-Pleurochrysis_carterae.AAC.1
MPTRRSKPHLARPPPPSETDGASRSIPHRTVATIAAPAPTRRSHHACRRCQGRAGRAPQAKARSASEASVPRQEHVSLRARLSASERPCQARDAHAGLHGAARARRRGPHHALRERLHHAQRLWIARAGAREAVRAESARQRAAPASPSSAQVVLGILRR